MKSTLALALFFCFTAGCDTVGSGRSEAREPGVLAPESPFEVAFSLPDTVRVRQTVPVTVVTLGGGCTKFGDTEVAFRGTGYDVLPYDLFTTPGRGEACTMELTYLPHTVLLTFGTPGVATVRAVGRTYGATALVPTTVERTVVVVPAEG